MGMFYELEECAKKAGYVFANADNEHRFWRHIVKTLQFRINRELSKTYVGEESRLFGELDDPREIFEWLDNHKTFKYLFDNQLSQIKTEIQEHKNIIVKKEQNEKESMENGSLYDEMKKSAIAAGIRFINSEDEAKFLDIVVEEVEVRIGAQISSECTSEELKEFDNLHDSFKIGEWLKKHVPDYKRIVIREKVRMKEEIHDNVAYIMKEKKRMRQ